MRLRLRRTQAACVLLLLTVAASSCAGKNVNTVVADTATYGATLMKGIRATAEAVAAAEAQNILPRNDAIKVMTTLSAITAKGEDAGKYLNLLLDAQGTPAAADLAGKVQVALDFIDSQLFAALLPIKDEALRTRISALAAEVSKLILTINRELLGRIR